MVHLNIASLLSQSFLKEDDVYVGGAGLCLLPPYERNCHSVNDGQENGKPPKGVSINYEGSPTKD